MSWEKRILFGASYSVIEPLGLLHLGGLARDEGWERKFHLVKDHDFKQFFKEVNDFKPDVVGFNVYTGNHIQLFEAFEKLKKDHPNVRTVVGGPHPTYFPSDSAQNADYVVMSEGFGSLRKILRGQAKPGILPMAGTEKFPMPDRETFYKEYPEHAGSRIKSIITMTGCPYTCTYCYNSSQPKDIADNMPEEIAERLAKAMGMGGRLFPHNVRSVDDVVMEGREIAEKWPTEVIYSQDDVHGFDINDWMPKFAQRWPAEVGLPYHAQMRWEMTKDKRRLDLLNEAGCFGLTLAIEAADPVIRKEVLSRGMPEELMFDGMKDIIDRGFKVRTEQITGLPYGATKDPTPINLDADLGLVELNVKLRELTGGPTMAWASTLAPYAGTKLGIYCQKNGHYENFGNNDVPDTFFERSVLKFPKEWVGPSLERVKKDPSVWLSPEDLERYRDENAELRRNFNFFTLVPEGHKLAESYIKKKEDFTYERLGRETEAHLKKLSETNNEARELYEKISVVRDNISKISMSNGISEDMKTLAPYFACLPKPNPLIERVLRYSLNGTNKGELSVNPRTLSDAVRHHLYDENLYSTEENKGLENSRSLYKERYASKI